ncbi:MAG: hypothetical protein VCC36_10785 [Gammaproteobacteria bacterium]|jgi:hypothetical protein
MLIFFNRLAQRLYRLRVVLWIVGATSTALFGAALFSSGGTIDAAYALVSLTLLFWALWLLAVAYSFVEPAPVVDSGARFWARVKVKLRRAMFWILAVAMTLLFVLALVMTTRAIGIVLER